MVLGLINFLLGGKKQAKVSKSAQVTTPLNNVGGGSVSQVPNNQNNSPPVNNNNTNLEFQNNSGNSQNTTQNPRSSNGGQKKSLSEVIGKIHEELKSTNDKIGGIVTDVRDVQNKVNTLGHRIDDLEENKKITEDKLGEIDSNMGKFLSLYELINNQYNPFVENEKPVKKIEIQSDGNSLPQKEINVEPKSFEDLNLNNKSNLNNNSNSNKISEEIDLDSSLLELDTLNIEEAAADAVPLTKLKNNTNSLVIILSWLEYLIKKVGIEEARNSLRYYTETLRWITPEVFFDLDKYLKGMKDKVEIEKESRLTIKDHIVSLYFISKLNEKSLDSKLTKAVLQIIKN